jgi:hypothetical protein
MAAGSVGWGAVAARSGLQTALLLAGLGSIATTALGLVVRLPDSTADVSPWQHWRAPAVVTDAEPDLDDGPVLVTVEYLVDRDREAAFVETLERYGRVRRRDGASRWEFFRDVENADRYLETFLVGSWAEHLRQHERSTYADRELEQRLQGYARGVPHVRHLVHISSDR